MVKIAISGKAKSGKNSLASFIRNHIDDLQEFISDNRALPTYYKPIPIIMAFADPIKRAVLDLFPEADRHYLFGPSELREYVIPGEYTDDKGEPLTYRQALMDIGALGRKYNNNFWIDKFDTTMKSIKDSSIIASDLRFLNEYEYLKTNNFFTIRIVRDIITKLDDISEIEQDALSNDKFDLVIVNNKSLEDLDMHAKSLVNKLIC